MPLLIGSLLGAGAAHGQAPRSEPERVAWSLVDFVVLGDSMHGVQVLMSPNLQTVRGQSDSGDITIALDPVVARQWLLAAARVIDSVANLSREQRHPFALAPLRANRGKNLLLVSLKDSRPSDRPFVFAIISPTQPPTGVRLNASASELRSLFTVIDELAQRSAVDSSDTTLFLECDLDRPPRVRRQGMIGYPPAELNARREGRVLAEYTIDTTGAVVRASFRTLLTDGDDFSEEARAAILDTRFSPGVKAGRTVDTRVWQWVKFKMRRPPAPGWR